MIVLIEFIESITITIADTGIRVPTIAEVVRSEFRTPARSSKNRPKIKVKREAGSDDDEFKYKEVTEIPVINALTTNQETRGMIIVIVFG